MTYAGQADEPMAEFWSLARAPAIPPVRKEMASAAHVYGKRIVGAEVVHGHATPRSGSKSSGQHQDLGRLGFCEGINRFVFHRYAMQPWLNRRPGMSMGPWGLHYERTQTWWEQSRPWHEYLARCQVLLRQGLSRGRHLPLAGRECRAKFQPHDRNGYDYDNCSARGGF